MKKDARRTQHLEKLAGQVSTKSVADKVLQRDRIFQALRPGPGPDNAVRVKREAAAVTKARKQYTRGLATVLGSNLTMVRRHLEHEQVTKQRALGRRAVAAEVDERRAAAAAMHGHLETVKLAEVGARSAGRKAMITELSQGAVAQRRAQDFRTGEVREHREVLKWSEHKSGLIPVDPVLAQRKANAATKHEFLAAVAEDSARVDAIRAERFARSSMAKTRHLERGPTPLHLDGSGVFHAATSPCTHTSAELDLGSGPLLDGAWSTGGGDGLQILGEVVEPPTSMKAAARVFDRTAMTRAHPGFLTGSQRG